MYLYACARSRLFGGLIQRVNKMDLISALQFLKLKEVSQGEILRVMQNCIDIFLC